MLPISAMPRPKSNSVLNIRNQNVKCQSGKSVYVYQVKDIANTADFSYQTKSIIQKKCFDALTFIRLVAGVSLVLVFYSHFI